MTQFVGNDDQALIDEFSSRGYITHPVDDRGALDSLRAYIVERLCHHLGIDAPEMEEHTDFLDRIHEHLGLDRLNDVRLQLFNDLNEQEWLRPTYYRLGKSIIDRVVGNELAMQNKVNISIQIPNDDSSTLPLHADSFGGETPYQVVEWLPLVDCHDTKSMFVLPKERNDALLPKLQEFEGKGMNEIMRAVESDVEWIDVAFGEVLVFMPHLLHGNVVNRESFTRWSMNSRFTGLFTPYTSAEKKLGAYYQPITTRPVTELALRYIEPNGFTE